MNSAIIDESAPASAVKIRSAIIGVGTSVPSFESTQENTLDFVLNNFNVKESTRQLYRRIFSHKSIQKRYFAVNSLSDVLERDHEKINRRFEERAVELSARALKTALLSAGLSSQDVDYIAVTACTGYLCPGLSALLVPVCGLRRDVHLTDVAGMGCGAAVPALEAARNFTLANPGAVAAVVSTEICSAAMFSDDAVDLVVSNAIFADGSAAAIVRSERSDSNMENAGKGATLLGFESLVVPEWKDTLRFKTDGGYLRNVLGKDVPKQSAVAVKTISDKLLGRFNLSREDVACWIVHAGGDKILSHIEEDLKLPPFALEPSRTVLKEFGNISSPTVLFVLNETLKTRFPRKGDVGLIASFGAGFSAHAALVEF